MNTWEWLRKQLKDRIDTLTSAIVKGLPEEIYRKACGEITGLKYALGLVDENEKIDLDKEENT